MAAKFETAEEMIHSYREVLLAKLDTAHSLAALLPELPEPLHTKLLATMDDAEELGAAIAALDVALLELARPMQPVSDELRG